MSLALLPLPPSGHVSPVGSDYSLGFTEDFFAIYDADDVKTRVIFPGKTQQSQGSEQEASVSQGSVSQSQKTGEAVHKIGPATLLKPEDVVEKDLQPATEAEIHALFQAHNIKEEELNDWFSSNTHYYFKTTLAIIGGVATLGIIVYSVRNPEGAKKHVYSAFDYVKSTAAHYLGKIFV